MFRASGVVVNGRLIKCGGIAGWASSLAWLSQAAPCQHGVAKHLRWAVNAAAVAAQYLAAQRLKPLVDVGTGVKRHSDKPGQAHGL